MDRPQDGTHKMADARTEAWNKLPKAERDAIKEQHRQIEWQKLTPEQRSEANRRLSGQQDDLLNQEMLPGSPSDDRFQVKVSTDREAEALPGLETKFGEDWDIQNDRGQLVYRKKGSTGPWNVIDPKGKSKTNLEAIKETLRDMSDLAYDAPAAVVEGAAQALGGIYGGGPLGAAGAGLAAGAVTSAGKQGIKALTGYGEPSLTDVGINAGLSAFPGLAFGGQAGVKQIGKAVTKDAFAKKMLDAGGHYVPEVLTDLDRKLAAEVVGERQKGLLQRGIGTAGEIMTSVPADAHKTARKDIQIAEALKKHGAVLQNSTRVANDFSEKLRDAEKVTGGIIGQEIDKSRVPFNSEAYVWPIFREISRLGELAPTENTLARIENLKALHRDYFVNKETGEALGEISASNLFDLKQALKEPARVSQVAKAGGVVPEGAKIMDRETINVASDIGRRITKDLDEASSKYAKEASSKYRDLKAMRRVLGSRLKDAVSTSATLNKASRQNQVTLLQTMQNADRMLGTNMGPEIQNMKSLSLWGDPSPTAMSTKSGTSTTKTVVSRGLGRWLGNWLGLGMDAPQPIIAGMTEAGGAALPAVSSPLAVKKYYQMTQPLADAGEYMKSGILNAAPFMSYTPSISGMATREAPSIWDLMTEKERTNKLGGR